VKSTLYKECVRLIQNTGDTLKLKVIINSSEEDVSTALLQPSTTKAGKLRQREFILPCILQMSECTEYLNFSVAGAAPKHNPYVNIPDFLEATRCIYSTTISDDMPSVVQCFEIVRPHCKNLEGPLDAVFNTIVDETLTTNILLDMLGGQKAAADILTAYVVDSLKRQHALCDILSLLIKTLDLVTDDHLAKKYESFVDQMTKRMLLVQTLENMSYESQRFLCNFIRKNELAIPLSYRIWDPVERVMR
jgi:hypothetical protein